MDIKSQDLTQINDGHYLELLDRVYVATSMLETFCLGHPLTKEDSEIRSRLRAALVELAEAYQLIGAKMYNQK